MNAELTNDLLPNKSRERYEWCYKQYTLWCERNNANLLSENVILDYFSNLAESFKSPTLWKTYSMLRTTIDSKHNTNIADYSTLKSFLKEKSEGYQARKSKVLSAQEINKFIKEAPDEIYLCTKVALIVGLVGACKKNELYQMKIYDVQDLGEAILVHIPDYETNVPRDFAITGEYYQVFKKYLALRPSNVERNNLFLNFQKGRCTHQVLGINKLGTISKSVAKYLNLNEPELYTGYCIRRTSATMLKRRGRWKSSQEEEG